MEKFVIYLEDIDPDSGDISQIVKVCTVEDMGSHDATEHYARVITEFLNEHEEGGGDGSRTVKYADLEAYDLIKNKQ